jgi:hypothetical protein
MDGDLGRSDGGHDSALPRCAGRRLNLVRRASCFEAWRLLSPKHRIAVSAGEGFISPTPQFSQDLSSNATASRSLAGLQRLLPSSVRA